jgi:hypothetical protein
MNIVAKLPAIKPELMSGTALTPFRAVDAHSLPHRKASKAARAVIAADILDGLMVLQNPTVSIVTVALGVSASSVANARRLTPEQRDAVRKGRRPLVLPTKPAPLRLPPPAVANSAPAPVSAREKLAEVVAEVGVNTTIDMIAELDCSAAA